MFEKEVNILKNKGTIAYPTETVYGVGGDALSEISIKKIFDIKKRPLDKPISLAVSSWDMLESVALISQSDKKALKNVLPGPLTILAKKREVVPSILTSGSEKVGIRFPSCDVALQIISKFGKPITSTSANITGGEPPKRGKEIKIEVDSVVDWGKTPLNLPSTILDLESREVKRVGPILRSEIKKILWK